MPDHSILLIDPFKNLLVAFRMVLEGEAYQVETASNIEDGIQRLSAHRYSVIVMEFFPPLNDTYLMIQRAKQTSPETYVIMITNTVIDEIAYEKLFAIGLDDLILKPYSPAKILAHIKKGLERRDLIIRKQQLEKQSPIGPLDRQLQVFDLNPIYFKKCIHRELKRAKRHQHPLTLLLIEMPAKDAIGDRLDSFYLELTKILKRCIREEDIFGKDNGHFGILLPETDRAGSQAFIERFSHLVQTHPAFQSDSILRPIVQTLSIQSFIYPDEFFIPDSLKTVLNNNSETGL